VVANEAAHGSDDQVNNPDLWFTSTFSGSLKTPSRAYL